MCSQCLEGSHCKLGAHGERHVGAGPHLRNGYCHEARQALSAVLNRRAEGYPAIVSKATVRVRKSRRGDDSVRFDTGPGAIADRIQR